MSFSSEIKDEIAKQLPGAMHCMEAELSSLLAACAGVIRTNHGKNELIIKTENYPVVRKIFILIRKLYRYSAELVIKRNRNTGVTLYILVVDEQETVKKILISGQKEPDRMCCKRSYLKGCFLTAGSVSDPEKGYHFELVFPDIKRAEMVRGLIADFEIEAKIVVRKKNYVVYLKEGSQIVDMLNIIEAHVALMNFENVRILKEVRNSVNRQVNCDTANIKKVVAAAARQIEDIEYLRDTIGFDGMNKGLAEIAELRLQYPDSPIKELGMMLTPPIGKSGVNHRLNKISEIADNIRMSRGGK